MAEVQRKATQKDMTKRYQSCREFQLELFGKKTISPSLVNRISIGRGDCDIKINDPRNKVSSYHADVEMILLSEYISYIYYDKSTNGSLVNGQKLHNSHIEVYR